jgi:hypothetical protein
LQNRSQSPKERTQAVLVLFRSPSACTVQLHRADDPAEARRNGPSPSKGACRRRAAPGRGNRAASRPAAMSRPTSFWLSITFSEPACLDRSGVFGSIPPMQVETTLEESTTVARGALDGAALASWLLLPAGLGSEARSSTKTDLRTGCPPAPPYDADPHLALPPTGCSCRVSWHGHINLARGNASPGIFGQTPPIEGAIEVVQGEDRAQGELPRGDGTGSQVDPLSVSHASLQRVGAHLDEDHLPLWGTGGSRGGRLSRRDAHVREGERMWRRGEDGCRHDEVDRSDRYRQDKQDTSCCDGRRQAWGRTHADLHRLPAWKVCACAMPSCLPRQGNRAASRPSFTIL